MSELQIISKGLYKGEVDVSFPISVKEYIFARQNGKKCLLLRFFTSSDIKFTAIHFWLIQKNSYGEKIRRRKIVLDSLYYNDGQVFSPTNCFVVDDRCVDFEIKIVSAFVGDFEYKSRNGEGFVRYSADSNEKIEIKRKASCSQSRKLNAKVKYTALILVFAVFLIAFAIIWPFFKAEVYPIIKNALKIGWSIFVKALESFFKMIGELVANIFDGNKA
jgi:hypothetical protein